MQYTRVNFRCNPNTETIKDILSALLAEIGYDAFAEAGAVWEAYIPTARFSADEIEAVLAAFPVEASITYTADEMEDKDWNEEWEKNYFRPIVIGNQVYIHSSFHPPVEEYRHRIVIDPKMSFGTGHHETTGLMLEELLKMKLTGKSVLDMGCGTAVLAILASMRGAADVTAIDIDEWAYRNALENVKLNDARAVRVEHGGAERLEAGRTYDVILANINRNILLHDIPKYSAVLNKGGSLVISGFYRVDIPVLRAKAEEAGLAYRHTSEKGEWIAVSFCRP